jgi:hypothetical protein
VNAQEKKSEGKEKRRKRKEGGERMGVLFICFKYMHAERKERGKQSRERKNPRMPGWKESLLPFYFTLLAIHSLRFSNKNVTALLVWPYGPSSGFFYACLSSV